MYALSMSTLLRAAAFRWALPIALVGAAAAAAAAGPSPSKAFADYWMQGLAEVSTYAVTTERYGELRRAQAVMVFVTEELDDRTRIKVESGRTPRERRVPVLKLNHVLKFNTGIYDYSLMTSVFAGLSGPGVTRPFEPRKISFSAQEWCGNVYHQLVPGAAGVRSEIRSYFEADGDTEYTLRYPAGTMLYEDELPILLRELDGEWLKAGEAREVQLVPSLWSVRKRHVPVSLSKATITKERKEQRTLAGREREVWKWTLKKGGAVTAYFVEAAQPHKLLGWEDGRGERGVLIETVRNAYWEKHANRDEHLRKELGLAYGVGD
jgi:hypothetical protein